MRRPNTRCRFGPTACGPPASKLWQKRHHMKSFSALPLSFGTAPAVASATVHTAECVTTGVSALSHHAFGNVSRDLFRRLLLPGVVGMLLDLAIGRLQKAVNYVD